MVIMKTASECLALLISAILLELGVATAATILAHRTNTVGLGWLVPPAWLVIALVLGYLARSRLRIAARVTVLIMSFLLSLALFGPVCLQVLRGSTLLKGGV
jgi:hypothetical protein